MKRLNVKSIIFLLCLIYCATGIPSCDIFRGLDDLRQEADSLLVSHPKTNYQRLHIDFSHQILPNRASYNYLITALELNDIELIDTPEPDENIEGDTELLAALREDIGVLIINSPERVFSPKELRAVELFVLFGGRIISDAKGFIQGRDLFNRFGVEVGSNVDNDEGMYFASPGDGPDRGHLLNIIDSQYKSGFSAANNAVFLFPNKLSLQRDHELFSHQAIAIKAVEGGDTLAVKAIPKLNLQNEEGAFIALGDDFFMQAPVEGGSGLPDRSGYQGGIITNANCQFLLNLIMQPTDEVIIKDNEGPILNLSMPSPLLPSTNGLVRVQGTISDLGGVERISYHLNGEEIRNAFDPINRPLERSRVFRNVSPVLQFVFSESELQLGTNTLFVEVADQFQNISATTISFEFALRNSGRSIELISTQPNSDEIDLESGLDLFGSAFSYENLSIFGGPLTTSLWNGGNECQESGSRILLAHRSMASAPNGAGRVKQMDMPSTSRAIQNANGFESLLTFHFEQINLTDGVIQLNGAERRDYNNIDGSQFIVRYNSTPILSAPMADFRFIVDHNAPGNCNDDVITGTSTVIQSNDMRILPDLATRELTIASAFLADLTGTFGMRLTGTVFNRVIHGGQSDAFFHSPNGTVLRYPLGVQHPDPAAVNLIGNAKIEILAGN